jgi:hypothetical protein
LIATTPGKEGTRALMQEHARTCKSVWPRPNCLLISSAARTKVTARNGAAAQVIFVVRTGMIIKAVVLQGHDGFVAKDWVLVES